MESLNKALFNNNFLPVEHMVFFKYTSPNYYKYSFDLLKLLFLKSNYKKYNNIFYISLYFYLKILKESGNNIYFKNLDILIFCCFYLGIKSSVNQTDNITINKLKMLYKEKYNGITNQEIKEGEIICLKLLNYNLNIMTPYDYLLYILNDNQEIIDETIEELDSKIILGIKYFIFCKPKELAEEIAEKIKIKKRLKNSNSNYKKINKKIQPLTLYMKTKKIQEKILKFRHILGGSAEKPKTLFKKYYNNNNFSKSNKICKINPLKTDIGIPIEGIYKKKLKNNVNISTRSKRINLISHCCSFTNNIKTNDNSSELKIDLFNIKNFYLDNNSSGSNKDLLNLKNSNSNIFKKPSINKNKVKTFFQIDNKKGSGIKNIRINFDNQTIRGNGLYYRNNNYYSIFKNEKSMNIFTEISSPYKPKKIKIN